MTPTRPESSMPNQEEDSEDTLAPDLLTDAEMRRRAAGLAVADRIAAATRGRIQGDSVALLVEDRER